MRFALALVLALTVPAAANACTCFFVANQAVALFARNYDWHFEQGVLTVNKRGVEKTALTYGAPASWESRYGSVTFNQYGRELPNDGMNEAGLAVAVMWLGQSVYPPADDRPGVGSAQWVQYQLDTSATVADVLASDERIRIAPGTGGLVHYLVADATGASAVIEWLAGERVVHTGAELAAAALSNSTYEESLAYLRRHKGFGGDKPTPTTRYSLDRFVRAAQAVATGKQTDDWSVARTFEGLANVAQAGRTQWSIVYDLRERSVRFKTRSASQVKQIALSALDLSTSTPTQVLNLAIQKAGDVAPLLVDFDTERNLREINVAFDATLFLRPMPAAMRERIARYPEQLCRPVGFSTGITGSGASGAANSLPGSPAITLPATPLGK